ncbi:hypothetical protein ACFL0Y_03730 [Patescibacteria group bacterium]
MTQVEVKPNYVLSALEHGGSGSGPSTVGWTGVRRLFVTGINNEADLGEALEAAGVTPIDVTDDGYVQVSEGDLKILKPHV